MAGNPFESLDTDTFNGASVSYSIDDDEFTIKDDVFTGVKVIGRGSRYIVCEAYTAHNEHVVLKALNRSRHDHNAYLDTFTLFVMAESFARLWPQVAQTPLRVPKTSLVQLPFGPALMQEFVPFYDIVAPPTVTHSFMHFAHELAHRLTAFEGELSCDQQAHPTQLIVRSFRAHSINPAAYGVFNCGLDGLLAFLADHPAGQGASTALGLPSIESKGGHPMVDDTEYVSDVALRLGGPPPIAQWSGDRYDTIKARASATLKLAAKAVGGGGGGGGASGFAAGSGASGATPQRQSTTTAGGGAGGAPSAAESTKGSAWAPTRSISIDGDAGDTTRGGVCAGDAGATVGRGGRAVTEAPSGVCGVPAPAGGYAPVACRTSFRGSGASIADVVTGAPLVALIGPAAALSSMAQSVDAAVGLAAGSTAAALRGCGVGTTQLWTPTTCVMMCVLPQKMSRLLSQTRAWAAASSVRAVHAAAAKLGPTTVPTIIHVCDSLAALPALAAATARAFPVADLRGRARGGWDSVADKDCLDASQRSGADVWFVDASHASVGSGAAQSVATVPLSAPSSDLLHALGAGVSLAAGLTDIPPSHLHVPQFVGRVRALVEQLKGMPQVRNSGGSLTVGVLRGEALRAGGYGGICAVGGAAAEAPALVTLQWRPAGYTPTADREAAEEAVRGGASAPTPHFVWVGKGIIFDTGGLSLKGKDFMPGMKCDMGGAAAVTGAFFAAVASGSAAGAGSEGGGPSNPAGGVGSYALTAVLCIAENSIGPDAYRPDDIITFRSGVTCEINNTDAEGRVVLSDGMMHACELLRDDGDTPTTITDIATLTGAQSVSTGRAVCAVVSNDEDAEGTLLTAARMCGEDAFPIPYMPEYHDRCLRSNVADCVNSATDRGDALCSVAGHFIAKCGLPGGGVRPTAPRWLHLDIAGPAKAEGRATGFGVGLLLAAANVKASAGAEWPRP